MKQRIYKEIVGIFLLVICCMGISLCACAKGTKVEFVTPEELESLTDESDAAMDFPDETMENKEPAPVAVTGVDGDAKEEMQVLESAIPDKVIVHVCGAVCNPGVYRLEIESRVIDAVMVAGGMTEEADSEYINLAGKICDGDKVRVPTKAETEEVQRVGKQIDIITSSNANTSGLQEVSGDKININTADVEHLCTLPGIGKTRAESIITYRKECGGFSTIEDIMNVSGIKEHSFQKIKEYITVD